MTLPLIVDPAAQRNLLALPESGMGFQHVFARYQGQITPFLILNASFAIDLTKAELHEGTHPDTIERNGAEVMKLVRESTEPAGVISSHHLTAVSLQTQRIMPSAQSSLTAVARPSALVKSYSLPKARKFFRYSPFKPDLRVDPATGDFAAGTYAAPESEDPFVPTGFIAVGRFALPSKLPASWRYELLAPKGTAVTFGTVAPAFGQSGGGVEVLLISAVRNQQVPWLGPTPLPDE